MRVFGKPALGERRQGAVAEAGPPDTRRSLHGAIMRAKSMRRNVEHGNIRRGA